MSPKPAHVALLRGVNLAGKHRLPMKELAAIFEEHGAGDVRTYIQSGNVVFRASVAQAKRIPGLVAATIAERYGFEAPVVVRSASEMAAVVRNNPFPKSEEGMTHVVFLDDRPSPARARGLDPERSPGDRFVIRGRDIYLRLPNGAARTKLSAPWFDRHLDTVSTFRNWRTVLKLLEMTAKS